MDVLGLYLDASTLDAVLSFFGLLPVGVLLAVLAWMVTIVVHACFRWLKG